MKKILLAVAIATAGLMTSCAVSEHLTSNRNVMQTNVELSKNNFQVIGTAQGSATVIRVFGIGGLSLKAIRANAYAEMVKNANLSGSQALINVNTEVKQRGVAPFYWKTVITTCGQVIEFISTEEQVSEHHAGTAKRFAPRTAETTMAEEIIVVDPIAKIKSNTRHLVNTEFPISVTLSGIMMLSSLLQSKNAFSGMLVILFLNVKIPCPSIYSLLINCGCFAILTEMGLSFSAV